MTGECSIGLARDALFTANGTTQPCPAEFKSNRSPVSIESLGGIFSLFEDNDNFHPVVNYKIFPPAIQNTLKSLDSHSQIDLIFLFMNYDNSNGFTNEFEKLVKKKIAPASLNLPEDKISIKAFSIDGDEYTMSAITDSIQDNPHLRGIFIFDFNEAPEVANLNQIEELKLCEIRSSNGNDECYTLKKLLQTMNYIEGSQALIIGLFTQQLQTSIFQDEYLLDSFLNELGEDIAAVILPASRNPIEHDFMFELAGFIEFLQFFFTTEGPYLDAVDAAQKEIKARIIAEYREEGMFDEEAASRASTIFLGCEKNRVSSNISQAKGFQFEMRDIHKTHLTQIDQVISEIEDDEDSIYDSDACNKIVEEIKKYVFSSLHGLNLLINFLEHENDEHVYLKKLIFSLIMGMQVDLFTDSTREKLKNRGELLQKWQRFHEAQGSDARIIGQPTFSRLEEQTTEAKYMRGLEFSLADLRTNTGKGSSLIFQQLCVEESCPEILTKLISSLEDRSIPIPPVHQKSIQLTLHLIFNKEIISSLLAIYFQCKDVTHNPSLVDTMAVNPSYSCLFWSRERTSLNKAKLQKHLSKLNEAILDTECQEFSYNEVGREVKTGPLGWFKGGIE